MTNGSPMAIADTLPPVDFGFDDLKARMAQFTAKFDEFIEKGRKRVLEERNEYKVRRVELEGRSHEIRFDSSGEREKCDV